MVVRSTDKGGGMDRESGDNDDDNDEEAESSSLWS
jgi:hypothetical protein